MTIPTHEMILAGARAMRRRLCGLTVMEARQLAEVAYLAMREASAIEARSDATPKSGAAEGESATREAGDAQ